MSATAAEIRTAMASQITTVFGGALQAQPYMLANISPPCASVMRGPIEYDQAMMGGVHFWTFVVRVFVASTTDIGSQTSLDEYLSPDGSSSIKAAIESDRTLGGKVSDLHVTGASGEQELLREQGGPLLFSEWAVTIWA